MKTFEAPQLMELGFEFTAEGVFGGSGTPVPNPPSAWLNDDNNNGGSHTDVRVHFQNPLNEACERFRIYIDILMLTNGQISYSKLLLKAVLFVNQVQVVQ